MKFSKWILRACCTISAALLLTSCGKAGSDATETSVTTDTNSTSLVTTETIEVTENITMEDLSKYKIIRPEDASQAVIQAGVALRTALIETFDVELSLKSDLFSETVQALKIGEYEILLGACDRDETRQFMENLKKNDYGYAMIGKKLVICGGSDEATLRAFDLFMNDVIKAAKENDELFFDGNKAVLERADYEIDTLSLQGKDISEFSVVYPNKNDNCEALANELIDRIADKTGLILTLKSDKVESTGYEILIGQTNRTDCAYTAQELNEGTYIIGADDRYICARGADGIGDYYAVYALIASLLENAKVEHQVTLEASKMDTVPLEDALKAMSFNVWVSSPTSERMESVRQTIMHYLPDTIGVQEASPAWMTYLNSAIGDIYDYVGLGRDGGSKGEHSAIFYRKDRFELVETGTKWMSSTPDVVSKFKESSLPRVFTYAILTEKKSNTDIMVVNTHLEHTSATARNLQVKVLMDFLKDYTEYPIVLTGDFNANPESEVYSMVTAQLADSSNVAQKAERHYTFHNYGSASTYIDFAFVSRNSIAVSHYKVITEKMNGMLPSDHYALIIEYRVLG